MSPGRLSVTAAYPPSHAQTDLPWGWRRAGKESPGSTRHNKTKEWCRLMVFPGLSTPTLSWSVIQVLI